jgi:hypothetical protein
MTIEFTTPEVSGPASKMIAQIIIGRHRGQVVSDPHLMDGLETPYVDESEYFSVKKTETKNDGQGGES